jgi:hypothetical protein
MHPASGSIAASIAIAFVTVFIVASCEQFRLLLPCRSTFPWMDRDPIQHGSGRKDRGQAVRLPRLCHASQDSVLYVYTGAAGLSLRESNRGSRFRSIPGGDPRTLDLQFHEKRGLESGIDFGPAEDNLFGPYRTA